MRDEATGYIAHFHMKSRDEAGDELVELTTKLRTDAALNNPEMVRRIVLGLIGGLALGRSF
eukprot:COSAG06_NODE_2221_length_7313_cov_6.831577_1_plen_61_part_00